MTAEFMSSVNLSSTSRWHYPLKTIPRPTGKAARVIVTEYDLPRSETLPHDAAADSAGMIWYADFGSHFLGMLDPKTGKAVEYPLPITKPGAPVGSLDIVFDKQGDIWMGTMYQGSLAKFDRKTQKFQTWGSPTFLERDEARIAMVMPINHDVDGHVWIGGDNEYQVNVKTGEWRTVDYSVGLPKDSPIIRELSSYGVASDSKNNFYGLNLNGTYIIKVDGKTRKVTPFATPTPNSGPRRGLCLGGLRGRSPDQSDNGSSVNPRNGTGGKGANSSYRLSTARRGRRMKPHSRLLKHCRICAARARP